MNKKTHQSTSLSVGLISCNYIPIMSIPFLIGTFIGSSFPDNDLKVNRSITFSFSRKLLNFLGINKGKKRSIFTHRGITHTLIFVVALTFIMFLGLGYYSLDLAFKFCGGFSIGYFTHLICDCFTPLGCPLFYPLMPIDKRISFNCIKGNSFSESVIYVISLSYNLYWSLSLYLPSYAICISILFGCIYIAIITIMRMKKIYKSKISYKINFFSLVLIVILISIRLAKDHNIYVVVLSIIEKAKNIVI